MSELPPIDPSVRRAINRLLMVCRRSRMAPGDRFPTQDALRRDLHLTNHAISGAMAVLVETGVVVRRQRSGTVFNGFSSFPRSLLHVGIALANPAHNTVCQAAAQVFTSSVNALFRQGVGIQIFPIDRTKAWTPTRLSAIPELVDSVGEGAVDALLLPLQYMAKDQIAELESRGMPVVFCGCLDDEQCGVLIDHRAFARQAVEELHARGCRRLAIAYLDRPKPGHADFWHGFCEATQLLAQECGEQSLFTSDLQPGREGGLAVAAKLLALPPDQRPDGLIVPDDWLALGMQEALLSAGWAPPMVVQTNLQLPLPFQVPVSAHDIDLDGLAQAAANLALARLVEPWCPARTVRVVPRRSAVPLLPHGTDARSA